jgi:serine/threonine protein kinase
MQPENLMLSKRGHLKLIDFGTAEISNCTILKPEFKEHIIKLKQKADQKEL